MGVPASWVARLVKLKDYFGSSITRTWCEYLYDFGDDWLHNVKCYGLRQIPENFKRRLLDGGGMTPPEDCGGPPGYERMVAYRKTGEDIYGDGEADLGEWLGDWPLNRPGFTGDLNS